MDSFYGAPRRPPCPPTIRPLGRTSMVPEVSVIDNSFVPRLPSCPDFSKKHVRFWGPHFEKENVPETLKTAPNLKGKTFKQIYLANVPDRHLDLSIFETAPTGAQLKEKDDSITQLSNFKRMELKSIENRPPSPKDGGSPPILNKCDSPKYRDDSIAQLSNFKRMELKSIENRPLSPKDRGSPPILNKYRDRIENKSISYKYRDSPPVMFHPEPHKKPLKPQSVEICTQTEPLCTEIAPTNDEPTIKDLFRIIQQQNEQIMLLQRQVNNLRTIRQTEEAPGSPKKGLFSVDVKATSFEFSFRPQKLRKDFLEPKIQEITETNTNNSLHLDESLDVKDSYVSNAPSIAIEMDEYESSDEDSPEVGLTFYKELMNQVNNALKKASTPQQSMKEVKQATLQHLKNIGVNLTPIQESSEVTEPPESDVSCVVQQLLMKYLPSEKLAKAVHKKEKVKVPLNSEHSFATLQYLKKYNLIGKERPPTAAPRILDVTALKMQPKLL